MGERVGGWPGAATDAVTSSRTEGQGCLPPPPATCHPYCAELNVLLHLGQSGIHCHFWVSMWLLQFSEEPAATLGAALEQ